MQMALQLAVKNLLYLFSFKRLTYLETYDSFQTLECGHNVK